jgi:hypothetical protein
VSAIPAPPDDARPRRLLLVTHRSMNDHGDFLRIAEQIRREAPDVRPLVLRDDHRPLLRARLALSPRPTLTYSSTPIRRFHPLRGAVLQGSQQTKVDELRALERAGVPVPRWKPLTRDAVPDVSDLGPYVVMKPEGAGRGADVRIVRADKVRWLEPITKMAAGTRRWIVQEFVHTGPWPVSQRVLSLCGTPLYAFRAEGDRSRAPLRHASDFSDGVGRNIVASHMGCSFRFCHDADVLELATRAHAAFPDVPLLGVDILRDAASGKLYVVEVNSSGKVWGFSSERGRSLQERLGSAYESQFDAMSRAARVLIAETRRRAR